MFDKETVEWLGAGSTSQVVHGKVAVLGTACDSAVCRLTQTRPVCL
jgi:hypothetical protein